jgi:ATP-dependent Clp endopeptidase proteolytic subunit ClpP
LKRNTARKAYNILEIGQDEAEINLYGEVVATHPTDWWTGEPIPGDFIAQDEFLRDLEKLSTKRKITVHINSVGGDLYAGIAIYNRLKSLSAQVITINDGLAASAGSVIFEAGNIRKVNTGSNLMIHSAACFLYGFYQNAELGQVQNELEAHNKAALNIYVERTGRPLEEIQTLVEAETWMTGQEAVDMGFADEVISADVQDPVVLRLSPDRTQMMVGKMQVAARCFGQIPASIPVATATEWQQLTSQTGGTQVEIRNLEELRTAYPDFVKQAEDAAFAKGGEAERARMKGIEDIQGAIGNAELVKNAKYGDQCMTAEQLAFAAMQAQAAIGATMLTNMSADAAESNASQVIPVPTQNAELHPQTEDEKAINLLTTRIVNGGM